MSEFKGTPGPWEIGYFVKSDIFADNGGKWVATLGSNELDGTEKELADEKSRIEAEESEKLAKEKAALLAPDRDKVKSFFEKFEELRKSFPELTSEQGISLAKEVSESMLLVRGIIVNESKKLL